MEFFQPHAQFPPADGAECDGVLVTAHKLGLEGFAAVGVRPRPDFTCHKRDEQGECDYENARHVVWALKGAKAFFTRRFDLKQSFSQAK